MVYFHQGPKPDKNNHKVKPGLVKFIRSAFDQNREFADAEFEYSVSAKPVGSGNELEVRITHDKLALRFRINGNQGSTGAIISLEKAIPIQGDVLEGDFRRATEDDYKTAIEIFERVISTIQNRR